WTRVAAAAEPDAAARPAAPALPADRREAGAPLTPPDRPAVSPSPSDGGGPSASAVSQMYGRWVDFRLIHGWGAQEAGMTVVAPDRWHFGRGRQPFQGCPSVGAQHRRGRRVAS